jgi:hypothetical protein
MRIFEQQTFDGLLDRDSAKTFSEMELRRCHFQSCVLSIADEPRNRSTVRNVRLVESSQLGCTVYGAIVDDVLVDGLNTNGQLLRTWGAVFNRVVLRGKIDPLMISNEVLPSVLRVEADRQREIEAFRTANAEYYKCVEWALDISRGEFKELDIRGVPTHQIRYDSETQAIVTREKALQGHWRELDFLENLWPTALELFLRRGEPSTVLVAAKRHAKFCRYLDDLRLLRKAGVAEPE